MKKAAGRPVRLGVCLLLVMAALASVVVSSSSKPKLYRGKTVRQWVSLLDPRVDHHQEHEEASSVLLQIGAPAIPELEHILMWRPGMFDTVRGYAVRLGAKPRSVNPFEFQDRACEAAYLLAEQAKVDISRLVPQLQYHFTNGGYSSSGGRALAAAGPTGIAVLTNALFTGKRSVRDHAGWALEYVRGRPEVIEALIRSATNDPDPTLRVFAARHIDAISDRRERVRDVIEHPLRDETAKQINQ